MMIKLFLLVWGLVTAVMAGTAIRYTWKVEGLINRTLSNARAERPITPEMLANLLDGVNYGITTTQWVIVMLLVWVLALAGYLLYRIWYVEYEASRRVY